jgi:lambda repressor-like predicted transcriptional regulator
MPENVRGKHPRRVLAEIQVLHGSCRVLAERLGVQPSAISHVLRDPLFSMKLERGIALALGTSLHAIWPDRWTEDGKSRPRSQRAQIAMPGRINSSQKRKAA